MSRRWGHAPGNGTYNSPPITNGSSKSSPNPGSGSASAPGSTPSNSTTIYQFYPMSTDEQLRTMFIGNLPKGIPDDRMTAALETISGFQKWLRVINASGKPLNFGFARFVNPMSTKVALEVLPKVQYNKDIDNGTTVAHLKISVEPNTLNWLVVKASHGTVESHQGLSAKDLETRINFIISKWQKTASDAKDDDNLEDSINDGDLIEFINRSIKGSQSQEFASNVNQSEAEVLREEIKNFREQSLKVEKARILANEEYERKKQKELEEKSARLLKSSNEKDINVNLLKGVEPSPLMKEFEKYEMLDEEEDEAQTNGEGSEDDDLLLEKKRQEKSNENKEQLFKRRERRWLAREAAHLAAVKREKEREENVELRLKSAHESSLKEYASFSDKEQEMLREYEYYSNHSQWVKDRISIRRRELERDSKDIEDERRENEALPDTAIRTTATNKKISLSLSGAFAAKPALPESEVGISWTKEAQDEKKGIAVTSRIELEMEIQKSESNLFEWEIKWDVLDENILEDSLRPLIESNIVEYLGVQEEDLVNFVLDHLRSHKSGEELITELEMTLDEDAPVFTKKLWRLLISETEIKYRNIK